MTRLKIRVLIGPSFELCTHGIALFYQNPQGV